MGGAEYQSSGGATAFTDLTDVPAFSGNALRNLRLGETAAALEFRHDTNEVINVEEARSDIRSITRSGYSTYNSYAGLQALIDAAGEYKTFRFPANSRFNLGGSALITKAEGQSFVSEGIGCELQSGGFDVRNRLTNINGFFLTGATPIYGVHVNIPSTSTLSTQNRFQTSNHNYFAHNRYENLFIQGKSKGFYVSSSYGTWSTTRFVRIWNCAEGLTISMLDHALDTGHSVYYAVHAQSCSTAGFYIIKNGGLTMTDCKAWDCPSNLLIEPTAAVGSLSTGPQGLYFSNCQFEDPSTGGQAVKISAHSSLSSTFYPRNIMFVGGTMHSFLMDKFKQVSMNGVLLAGTGNFTYNTPGVDLQVYGGGCDPEALDIITKIGGSGLDYVIYGSNPTQGPVIKTGRRLRLIDSTGSKLL